MGAESRMAEHVVLGSEGVFQCMHCGASYAMALPAPLEVWRAAVKAYAKVHAVCRRPNERMCSACLERGHEIEDHVRLFVQSPEQWPGCGDTGTSSRAIWRHMMGRQQDGPWPPWDPDDFGRCYRLLHAPWAEPWRARIEEMARYRGWAGLARHWDELERLYEEERPGGRTSPLYTRMRELLAKEGL